MKKLLTILIVFISAICYGVPRFTADFYKANPIDNLNKVVTLHVNQSKPSSFKAPQGFGAIRRIRAS